MSNTTNTTGESRPSRARFLVLGLLCALTFVLYLDRVCISQAVEPIQADLNLSNTQMSFILMAFTLAYGLFEVPTGHWGDRIGARKVLTRIAVWWSVFTALTAACQGFVSLIVVRFLFGAGEAGAYPNVAKIVARWYPDKERGRVQGLIQTAALVGGTVAPVVAAYLIGAVGWRWSFVLFGLTGIVWSVVFFSWFRDDPAQHPAVNEQELALLGSRSQGAGTHRHSIPWRAVSRSPSIWILGTIMTFASFNSYFYFSWFPKYLQAARDVERVEAGWLASLVLAGAAIGTLCGGFLDRPDKGVVARRWLGATAYGLAALALTVGVLADSPRVLAGCAALSCVAAMTTLSSWWSCAIEISGRHLGALFGLMNGMGVFGAMGSQFFVGVFADWRAAQGYTGRAQWDPMFLVYISVLLLAGLCWACFISRSIEEGQEPHETGES